MTVRRGPGSQILLIEDTPSLQLVYRSVLSAAGLSVQVAATAAEGLRLFRVTKPAVVLLDLMLPDRDGIELLNEILALAPETRVIVMTAHGSVDKAVSAMRAGAFEFLLKPFEENRFITAVNSALDTGRERDAAPAKVANRPGRRAPGEGVVQEPSTFIGSSPEMGAVYRTIASVARSMATVFITGESGTGKELAALAVHAQSARARGPFIALNCGAIPPDLLESEVFGHMKGSFTGAISDKPGAAVAADGGTLFLDEICEMAPALQTKLLRFLQTSTVQPVGAVRPKRVDVRIVCATNRDPLTAIRNGEFREDLFYRLYVVPLHLPPLRDRGRDIVEIAHTALVRFAAEEGKSFDGFSQETEQILLSHGWPGNVRQLLNTIRNIVVLNDGGRVTPDMLPLSIAPLLVQPQSEVLAMAQPRPLPPGKVDDPFRGLTLAEVEWQAIDAALARHDGSVPKAARDLDVSPSTLYRKLDQRKAARQP